MLRRLLTLRGLLGLLATLCACAGMLLLGRWQLGRGEQRHSLQNYAYAVEWVLFAVFALFCFVKLLQETDAPEDAEAPRDDVVLPRPVAAVDEPDDDELAAYNAYLARLNGQA